MKFSRLLIVCFVFQFSFAFAQHDSKEIDEIIRLKKINIIYQKRIEIETTKSVSLYNLAVYNTESGKLLLSQLTDDSPNADSDKQIASKLFDKAKLYSKRSDSIVGIVNLLHDSIKININRIYALAKTLKISNMDTILKPDAKQEVNRNPVIIKTLKPGQINKPAIKLDENKVSASDNRTYTVQIRADKKGDGQFKGIPDLKVIKSDDGYYRYFVGEYKTIDDAHNAKKKLVADGYKDAFIKIFKDH